jgi:hypothetical protein
MTAARPQQHGRASALTTAVLSLCSRSPSPPTAGNSARTRYTISPASIAGPAPSAAGKGHEPRFEVTWHGPDGIGRHRQNRVIQRVITRSTGMKDLARAVEPVPCLHPHPPGLG